VNDPTPKTIELPVSEHLHGCPMPTDRVESYELTRSDGVTVQVVRCVQCGGHSVDFNPREDHHA
jgi:hypothetical protein